MCACVLTTDALLVLNGAANERVLVAIQAKISRDPTVEVKLAQGNAYVSDLYDRVEQFLGSLPDACASCDSSHSLVSLLNRARSFASCLVGAGSRCSRFAVPSAAFACGPRCIAFIAQAGCAAVDACSASRVGDRQASSIHHPAQVLSCYAVYLRTSLSAVDCEPEPGHSLPNACRAAVSRGAEPHFGRVALLRHLQQPRTLIVRCFRCVSVCVCAAEVRVGF